MQPVKGSWGTRWSRLFLSTWAVMLCMYAYAIGNPSPAAAAEYTMKIGLVTLNDMQHNYARKYKEVLEQATNRRIEVQIYPQSQLGTPAAQIEGLQLGTIEMFMIVTDSLPALIRGLGSSAFLTCSKTRKPLTGRWLIPS
jgi:TRAP-type C4-dicarboxylate transport system substrate-binding protein